MGHIGECGRRGPVGEPGKTGVPGSVIATKGQKGEQGRRGAPGDKGLRGPAGPQGRQGQPGSMGSVGLSGQVGPRGEDGARGLPGVAGMVGEPGIRGADGLPGLAGRPGAPGNSFINHGFVFARHSQSSQVPSCPAGTSALWTGYSLLYTQANEQSNGQDLGRAGSCMKMFTPSPFHKCNLRNNCNAGGENDQTNWLSTGETVPSGTKVRGQDIKRFVSRCVVCEAPTEVMAVHSQESRVPNCPNNWESMYVGYSFVMNTGRGQGGCGQPLESAGSCLEQFRQTPFVQVSSRGECEFHPTSQSFWLTTSNNSDDFSAPSPSINYDDTGIARCQVCRRRPDVGEYDNADEYEDDYDLEKRHAERSNNTRASVSFDQRQHHHSRNV